MSFTTSPKVSSSRPETLLDTVVSCIGKLSVLAVCLSLGFAATPASAVTVWNGASGVSWTSVANWDNGLPDTGTPNPGTISSGSPVADAAQDANYNLSGTGILQVDFATAISSELIDISSGGRLQYNSDAGGNTIQLSDGGQLGRINASSPSIITSSDTISIVSGADVFLRGASNVDRRYLILTGDVSSGATTTVTRDTTSGAGEIRLSPSSGTGNTGLSSQFLLSGSSDAARGILGAEGVLPLGTAADGDVQVGSFGLLRLYSNTGVTSTGIIDVLSDGQVEIQGASSGNTLRMQDGSSLGRDPGQSGPSVVTSSDTIQIDPNAGITIFGANNVSTTRYLDFDGDISGTNVTITMRNRGGQIRPVRISSASGNALTGNLIVQGDSSTLLGKLELSGTNPIGTMDVQVQDFGHLEIRSAGIVDNRSIETSTDGNLFFMESASAATPSTLTGSILSGNGTITSTSPDETTARDLDLVNTTVTPGLSAGTLTFETNLLTMDATSTLIIEAGSFGTDLVVVNGDVDLTDGPTLQLEDNGAFSPGLHTILTYSGTLTGEFGSIVDNMYGEFTIDYGTGLNSSITLNLTPPPVPEPSSALLLGMGMLGLMLRRRRSANSRSAS